MHRAISLTSLLGALLSLVACADTRRSSALATPGAQEFQHRVANRGSITFRTWNGKLVGRDADAELTFFRDGSAHLFDWGISGERFWGTYHVHPDGCLAIWFEDHRNEWPVMIVHRDGDGDGALRLRPLNPPIGYREETRATIRDPNRNSYWNFGLLTGDQEKKVLDMIERQKHAERPPEQPG